MQSAGKILLASALCAVFAAGCSTTEIAPVSDASSQGAQKPGVSSVPTAPAAQPVAESVPLSGGSGFSAPTPAPAAASGAAASGAGTYTVQRGETLYRIAKNHGVSVSELMRANGITDPRKLEAGRVLTIPGAKGAAPAAASGVAAAPATAPAAHQVTPAKPAQPEEKPAAEAKPASGALATIPGTHETLVWPVKGNVVTQFSQQTRGIDISAPKGTAVKAAANGEVLLITSAYKSYGNLVILRHGDGTFVTTYGQVDTISVKKGQRVQSGQKIGTVGGLDPSKPMLHFEVRLSGKPADPAQYLR